MSKQNNYDRYINGYSGKSLLEKYSLGQTGVWRIFGEDPNCDMGGSHVQPDLGMVEGKLSDVIEYAVELSNFFAWGSGGDIKLLDAPKKINPDANRQRKALQAQLVELEADIAAVKAKLKEL
jgi:hypothetical protein